MLEDFPELQSIVDHADDNTKLAITTWVFEKLLENAKAGGSFRHFLYQRLGFKGPQSGAYPVIYDVGDEVVSRINLGGPAWYDNQDQGYEDEIDCYC